jgi:hypothetical protein
MSSYMNHHALRGYLDGHSVPATWAFPVLENHTSINETLDFKNRHEFRSVALIVLIDCLAV